MYTQDGHSRLSKDIADRWYNDEEYQRFATTEIWSNNQSQPHVRLPEGLVGHCLTPVNNTHLLLTGGYNGTSDRTRYSSTAAYLYSEEDGFTRIEDMKTARRDHGCSVINDSTVLVGGGEERATEYLDLTSRPGKDLNPSWSKN